MNKIALIIEREFKQRVLKKSFIITTLIVPLFMIAMILVPSLIATNIKDSTVRNIVVIDESDSIGSKLADSETIIYKITDKSYEDAVKEDVSSYGFLIIPQNVMENPSGIQLYTRGAAMIGVVNEIRGGINSIVENKRIENSDIPNLNNIIKSIKSNASITTFEIGENVDTAKQSSIEASTALSFIFGFFIYIFIFSYGTMVMQGVIEEKTNRIIEVIVSSVRPYELMMGKIIGIGCVAITQFAIWMVITIVGIIVAQSTIISPEQMASIAETAASSGGTFGAVTSTLLDPSLLIKVLSSFIVYFIGGYLLYAAMFAAVGSAVDNIQDVGQLQLPITIPLIISIMILMNVTINPHTPLSVAMSIIPFTSPIIMAARVPFGVPVWQYIVSVIVLFTTFAAMTWLAAKIYRTGIFMYGKKYSIGEIIKWIKYK